MFVVQPQRCRVLTGDVTREPQCCSRLSPGAGDKLGPADPGSDGADTKTSQGHVVLGLWTVLEHLIYIYGWIY